MHRVFRPGRRVFISRPRNHFPLREDAPHTLLMAGGIGVTPLIAMAHRLHALGRSFVLHYSAAGRASAGFVDELRAVPWADRVHEHFKDEGGRADLPSLVPAHQPGWQLYTCGAPRYMQAVMDTARAAGWPEEALHLEYFQAPDSAAAENHPFELLLARSGRRIAVAADRSATDALAEAGVAVDMKCSDGLCGVCAVGYDAAASGAIDHRDVVLGREERAHRIILCCSRALQPGGLIVLDR
jgi:ferredoxin-NADP reductase